MTPPSLKHCSVRFDVRKKGQDKPMCELAHYSIKLNFAFRRCAKQSEIITVFTDTLVNNTLLQAIAFHTLLFRFPDSFTLAFSTPANSASPGQRGDCVLMNAGPSLIRGVTACMESLLYMDVCHQWRI